MDKARSPYSYSSSKSSSSSSSLTKNNSLLDRRMILERRRQRHAAKIAAAKDGSTQPLHNQDHISDESVTVQRLNQNDNDNINTAFDDDSFTDDNFGHNATKNEDDGDDDSNYFHNVLQSALGKDSSKQFKYLFQSPKGQQKLSLHQNENEEEEINLLDEILSSTSSSTPLVEDESQSTTGSSVPRSSSHTMSSSHTASAARLLRRTLLETVPTSTPETATRNDNTQSHIAYLEDTSGQQALSPIGDANSSRRPRGSNKEEDELKLRLREITKQHEGTNALHELRRKRKLDKLPTGSKDGMPKPHMSSPTSTATTSSTNAATGTKDQRRNMQTAPTESSFFSPADTRSQKLSKTSATPLWASFVPKSSPSHEAAQQEDRRQNLVSQNEWGNTKQGYNVDVQSWKSPLLNLATNRGSVETRSSLTPEEPQFHADQQLLTQNQVGSSLPSSSPGNLAATVTTFSEQQQLKDRERLESLLEYERDRRFETQARLMALEMELKELRVGDGPQIVVNSTTTNTNSSLGSTPEVKDSNETSPAGEPLVYLSSPHQISPRRAMLQHVTQAFDQTEEDLVRSKNSRYPASTAKSNSSQDLISTTIAGKAKWWHASLDAEKRYLEEKKKCQELASELEALESNYVTERQEWQAQVKRLEKSREETSAKTKQSEVSEIKLLRLKLDEANAKIRDVESERDDMAMQLEQSKLQHSEEKLKWQELLDLAKSNRDNSQLETVEAQHAQEKTEWKAQRETFIQIESERDSLRVQLETVETQLDQATGRWKERLQQVEAEHKVQLEALETLRSHDDRRLGQYRGRLEEAEFDRDNAKAELENLMKSTAPEHGVEAINTSARVSDNGDDEWHDATDQYPSEAPENVEMRFTTAFSQLGTSSANDNRKKIDEMMQQKLLVEEKCEELIAKLKYAEDAHTKERDDMHARLNSAAEQIEAAQAEQDRYATARDEISAALEVMTDQYNKTQEKCNTLSAELRALETSHAKENEKWQSLLDTSLGDEPPLSRSNLEGDSVAPNVLVLQGRIGCLERQLDEVTTKHAKEQRNWHGQLQELMESPSKGQSGNSEHHSGSENGEAAVPTTEWKLQVERKRLELLERHCQSLEAKYAKQEKEWEEQMEIQLKRYKREESKCRQLSEKIDILQEELQRNGHESTTETDMEQLDTDNDQEKNMDISNRDDSPKVAISPNVAQTSAEIYELGLSVLGLDDTLDCSAIRAPLGSFDTGCNSVESRSDDLDLSLDAVITEMEEDCKDFNVLLEQVGSDGIPVPSKTRIGDHASQATQPEPSIACSDHFKDGESTMTPQGGKGADLQDASEKEATLDDSAFIDSAISLVHNLTDIVNHSESEDHSHKESQVFDQLEQLSMTLNEEETAKGTPSGGDESRLTVSIQAEDAESPGTNYDEEEGRATPPHANLSMLTHEFDPVSTDASNPWASLVQELHHKCEFLQTDRLELARTVNGMLDMERETHRLALNAAVATAEREASEKLVAFQNETKIHVKQLYSIMCEECRKQIFPIVQ